MQVWSCFQDLMIYNLVVFKRDHVIMVRCWTIDQFYVNTPESYKLSAQPTRLIYTSQF